MKIQLIVLVYYKGDVIIIFALTMIYNVAENCLFGIKQSLTLSIEA
jgi:hypothetical protein